MKSIINPWQYDSVIMHSKIIADCYKFWTGEPLFDSGNSPEEIATKMYHSSFIIVSHGIEKDPVFNYGNKMAQEIWKLGWEEFTSLPSRLSAEPIEFENREKLLEEGRQRGITILDKGIRIDKEGNRFYIKNVKLFNLQDEKGEYLGQAAIYENWEYL